MSQLFQRILERSKELEGETVRILADLVRTPSFSTKERDVVELIGREMRAIGFDEVRVDGLGSIIGRIGSGPRLVAFDAHIDTVYPGDMGQWSFSPFEPRIENGTIGGRGTVDEKGGMAAMLSAARIIRELDLNDQFTVLFTGTVMEEDCDGLCWQYLIREEHVRPELVIITEPTNLNIYRGHRGRMEISVGVTGRSAHGSAPERGDNAIYKMARIAAEIEKLNTRLANDSFLGKGSVAVTQVFSNSPSQCAIPDGASINLDRRLTRGETRESALAEVKEAAHRAGCMEATVEVLRYDAPAYTGLKYPTEKYYPTWTLAEDSPYLKSAARAYESLFGHAPRVDKWTFSTNAVAIAGMHGIPCLGFGPGDEKFAHAPDESCPVAHLSAASAFYAALVAQLNGKS
jgi:putative selenium metabolism hydrolase